MGLGEKASGCGSNRTLGRSVCWQVPLAASAIADPPNVRLQTGLGVVTDIAAERAPGAVRPAPVVSGFAGRGQRNPAGLLLGVAKETWVALQPVLKRSATCSRARPHRTRARRRGDGVAILAPSRVLGGF